MQDGVGAEEHEAVEARRDLARARQEGRDDEFAAVTAGPPPLVVTACQKSKRHHRVARPPREGGKGTLADSVLLVGEGGAALAPLAPPRRERERERESENVLSGPRVVFFSKERERERETRALCPCTGSPSPRDSTAVPPARANSPAFHPRNKNNRASSPVLRLASLSSSLLLFSFSFSLPSPAPCACSTQKQEARRFRRVHRFTRRRAQRVVVVRRERAAAVALQPATEKRNSLGGSFPTTPGSSRGSSDHANHQTLGMIRLQIAGTGGGLIATPRRASHSPTSSSARASSAPT